MLIVVGGPAGCGKSTAGNLIAEELSVPFVEGDSLHPKENLDKMSHGIPLTDDDRWGWLKSVAVTGADAAEKSKHGMCVAACSCLKKSYRDFISRQAPSQTVVFVFLPVQEAELLQRVSKRKNHFMKADMVRSQLDIMEVPKENEANCLVYWDSIDIHDCVTKIKSIEKAQSV